MKRIILTILGLVGLLTAPAAFAQNTTPFSQPQFYATAYNQWAISSANSAPNSYLFSPGGVCNAAASGTTFYAFNTNAPVLIVDATPANTEVVTPSTVTNTQSQCGFTASPANNHYSFQVRSGTAGLQEALNALANGPSSSYPGLLILDRNWYNAANVIPGTTPAAIIAAATGTTAIIVEDITTAPATFYVWGGSSYSPISLTPGTLFNKGVSSYTAISAPVAVSTAAPTNGLLTTATTGGTIPSSSTYRMALTYVDAAGGETLISTDTASTATIATGSGTETSTLTVTSPAAATGAVGYRVYLTAASGSTKTEILYTPTCTATTKQTILNSVCALGFPATIKAIVTGKATIPVVASAYPRTGGSSGNVPPFAAGGTVATTATGVMGVVNLPAGYFNQLGKTLTACGNITVTTNSTPGTLTLSAKLYSVYGVTSITPVAIVSGTTTASAVVSGPFCFAISTAATGATGTVWAHGWANFDLSGGSGIGVEAQDFAEAVSSAVDLTKQDTLAITITPTTTGTTSFQLTQLVLSPSN
jgi:hypothetical protein